MRHSRHGTGGQRPAAVPDYVVAVPRTVDKVSGTAVGAPDVGDRVAAALLAARAEVAAIIEELGNRR